MRQFVTTALFGLAFAVPVQAASEDDVARLFDAMRVSDVIEIMREEGLGYSETLAEEMLPNGATQTWQDSVRRIYNTEAMEAGLTAEFSEAVKDEDLDSVIAFFESELGRRIVDLEISAREALLDPAVEEASHDNFEQHLQDADPRLDLVTAYIEANGLVDANVVGALNSNFAFLRGLAEAGQNGAAMTESEMLASVWAQEEDVRSETRMWLYSYLLMAYAPLEDDELEAYIEMSESDAGRAMNRGLFEGFDPMFTGISAALGAEIAEIGSGEEL